MSALFDSSVAKECRTEFLSNRCVEQQANAKRSATFFLGGALQKNAPIWKPLSVLELDVGSNPRRKLRPGPIRTDHQLQIRSPVATETTTWLSWVCFRSSLRNPRKPIPFFCIHQDKSQKGILMGVVNRYGRFLAPRAQSTKCMALVLPRRSWPQSPSCSAWAQCLCSTGTSDVPRAAKEPCNLQGPKA